MTALTLLFANSRDRISVRHVRTEEYEVHDLIGFINKFQWHLKMF